MTSRLPLAAALLALALPARALEIHYSPAENLERLDVVIIDGAQAVRSAKTTILW